MNSPESEPEGSLSEDSGDTSKEESDSDGSSKMLRFDRVMA
ncbi:hypothetical protein K3495_g6935 [Podosphaera aphanis]|nr:hypothetical protein K3495_g6935 [Podosphaera aphanis]